MRAALVLLSQNVECEWCSRWPLRRIDRAISHCPQDIGGRTDQGWRAIDNDLPTPNHTFLAPAIVRPCLHGKRSSVVERIRDGRPRHVLERILLANNPTVTHGVAVCIAR